VHDHRDQGLEHGHSRDHLHQHHHE
jgi:hypothetical protein